jgi:hypothetical protein
MRRIRGVAAIILAIALLLSVTGCAQIAQQATKSAVENATGVKVDQNNGKTTVTGKDGSQATISGSEGKLPDGLPTYVPTYTGTVKSSASMSTDKGTTFTFSIETADNAQTIVDWYKKAFTDKGWTVTTTAITEGGGMISAKKGETDTAVVSISNNSEGKNEVAMVVETKK